MKDYLFLTLTSFATLLAACTSDLETIQQTEPEGQETVYLTFSPYTMEPMTKGGTYQSISTLASYLDVWLLEGSNVIDVHQASTDDGFGSISLVLDKTKTYTLYAIAHKANGAASLNNNIISFPDSKVTLSFFYKATFSPATTTSLNCQMKRIVGQFRFEIQDAVPDEVTQMKFTVYQTGTTFNASTETSASPIDKVTHYTSVSRAQDGSASFTVTIMADDMVNTSNFDIKVEALDANDDEVEVRTFEDVPIKNGYKTTYAGSFFISALTSASFLIDDWDSFDTVSF